jgi:hypothetical protein
MWGKGQDIGDKKRMCIPTQNNILVQVSKMLPTFSLAYEVSPSNSLHCVGDIAREKKINVRMKYVKV